MPDGSFSLLAGAVLLKVPLSTWPLINGTLAVLATCWAVALGIGYLSGLRGRPLVRRSLVYAIVISH